MHAPELPERLLAECNPVLLATAKNEPIDATRWCLSISLMLMDKCNI
ncbi:MAG: hypothetical protein ACI97K_002748 [Glaciecola sp.]|jgi:hypothetical protein